MNILYRAWVCAKPENANDRGISERMIFVSAENETQAITRIQIYASTHWLRSINSIEFHNLKTVDELFEESVSPELGNLCWFETGSFDGRPSYGGDDALFFAPDFVDVLVLTKHELLGGISQN